MAKQQNSGGAAKVVETLVRPTIEGMGLRLWDVRFEKEGPDWFLRVLVDRDEPLDTDTCEAVSRAIDPLLDAPEFDSLPSYTLCVSSAGLERSLRTPEHYRWGLGRQVELTFYRPHDGSKNKVGLLESFDDSSLTVDGQRYQLAEIASCREYYDFTSIN